MQSDEKYRGATVDVELADEVAADEPERAEFLRSHFGVPTDGIVAILYEQDEESNRDDGRWIAGTIPFRDHRTDGPWFAFPDKPKGRKQPIWEWTNPEEPVENITLAPSFGRHEGTDDDPWGGEWEIHCWIRNGEVDLL